MLLWATAPCHTFLPRDATYSADYAIARCLSVCVFVCLSVRLSDAGILSKRLDISSNFLTAEYPRHSSFSIPNFTAIDRWRPPNGLSNARGIKIAIFDQISIYL